MVLAPPSKLRFSTLLAMACLGTGCGDEFMLSTIGRMELSVTTSGVDPDPDGYIVVIDSGRGMTVPPNGTLVFEDIYAGHHQLTVQGIAPNCHAADNPRTIIIPSGGTLEGEITVTCVTNAGAVALWVQTTGEDPDTNGYTLNLDGLPAFHVPSIGGSTVGPLAAGSHALSLTDVAANCAPAPTVLTTTVPSGGVTQVTWKVACSSLTGRLLVSTTTGGTDLDEDGYTLTIDGALAEPLPANGTVTVSHVDPGPRFVTLTGVAWNCAVVTAPYTVSVQAGRTTPVSFEITCDPGSHLRVTTTTTGVDQDLDGYALTAADSAFATTRVPDSGVSLIGPVPPGMHAVQLADIAENCQVPGGATRSVAFALGDTATVAFDVVCAPAELIVFTRQGMSGLATVHVDGSEVHLLTTEWDHGPAWSADGTRLAFLRCMRFDFDDNCTLTDVFTSDLTEAHPILHGDDGISPTALAWKPDGSRIAFTGEYGGASGLFQMDPDGASVTPILLRAGLGHPSWAPDGSRLVMECTVDPGNPDLCLVNGDGSGFQRLTTASDSEYTPAWSPDGRRILFATKGASPGLQVMNADGSGQAVVLPGNLAWPTWSPDGQQIAVVDLDGCYDLYCSWDGILLATADGRVLDVLSAPGTEPAWRP